MLRTLDLVLVALFLLCRSRFLLPTFRRLSTAVLLTALCPIILLVGSTLFLTYSMHAPRSCDFTALLYFRSALPAAIADRSLVSHVVCTGRTAAEGIKVERCECGGSHSSLAWVVVQMLTFLVRLLL